ncbi:MAG: YraN family protein [Bacteroidetes bacterium]|nr:YraN family protein [Bacteroidota bacterium]
MNRKSASHSQKKALGRKGEEMAVRYLIKNGFEIIDRNFRIGRAEIDIIAKENEEWVFVEVKTRSSVKQGYPEQSISIKQEETLRSAALDFMFDRPEIPFIRFDVVAIHKEENRTHLKHFRDIFPSWG